MKTNRVPILAFLLSGAFLWLAVRPEGQVFVPTYDWPHLSPRDDRLVSRAVFGLGRAEVDRLVVFTADGRVISPNPERARSWTRYDLWYDNLYRRADGDIFVVPSGSEH